MNQKKKIILVTGSGKRIGREIVLGLSNLNKNYKFILHFNKSHSEVLNLKKKIKRIGIESEIINFDLNNLDNIESFSLNVEKIFGGVDILINNASIFEEKKLHNISEDDFDRMMNVNLKSPFFLSKFLSIGMKKRKYGKIINLTDSIGVAETWKDYSHYCISKGALETMTKALSLDLAPLIQVNSIAPGKILKPINFSDKLYKKEYNTKDGIQDIVNTTHLLIQSRIITGKSFKIDNIRNSD